MDTRKRMYEGKREHAARVMADETRKVEGVLTDEQVDLIDDVRTMRHEIHSAGRSMYLSESSDYNRNWEWLRGLTDRIASANEGAATLLPPWSLPRREDDYVSDADVYYCDADADEAEALCAEQMSEINKSLESWLGEIDDAHGTHFAPTGWARLAG
jgi:hypothetical protein